MWKVILLSKPLEKRHMNSVHNGKKNHKSQILMKHINTVHNGQKDHKCDSCRKSFSEAGNLKTHINSVHNGQKHKMYQVK